MAKWQPQSPPQLLLRLLPKSARKLPLKLVLTVPFIIQILASTGIVGYLAHRNGQRAISDLVSQLMEQASDRVEQRLETYLSLPVQLNQTNLDAIESGLIDVDDLEETSYYFWRLLDNYDFSYISYGLASGEFIGTGYDEAIQDIVIDEVSDRTQYQNHTYIADDSHGDKTKLVYRGEYDFQVEDWYASTVKKGGDTWSEVYFWEKNSDSLAIAASSPIRDQSGHIIGVVSIDFFLSAISDFIDKIKISENSRIFIIEPSGFLIASSNQESPAISKEDHEDPLQRRSVFESQDPLLRETATYLQEKFNGFENIQDSHQLIFSHYGQRKFLLVEPWRDEAGLDWLVVTVVPKNDFMAQINQTTRNTILLSILTLLVAIQVGLWTARWVTQPLLKLNRAAKEIEQGNLNPTINLNRQDELGELANSFNHMAAQLDTSFHDLERLNQSLTESERQLQHYSYTLEDQVQERTQALSQALEKIKVAQADLIESEKLAALGQLIAGIAHEINTPLGAIQASIGNIDHALGQSLRQMPDLFQMIPVERWPEFLGLLEVATQPKPLLSSREERQLRRQLTQYLSEQGIEQAQKLADILGKMGVSEGIDDLLGLLRHPDGLSILESIYSFSSIQNNSQNIQIAAERATKIVFALKTYAHQNQTERKVEASIADGIDTVLTLYYSQIKQGIEVVKRYESIPPVLCYPDELIQVWSNLIMNGIQAMNYKGRLEIVVSQEEEYAKVNISDTGSGIFDENIKRIFTPFFTTKPMGEGSGLGLHIVREIVEKHHGSIDVVSQPGSTVFTIKLPFSEV